MITASLFAVLSVVGAGEAGPAHQHPFLFVTPEDAARARASMAADPAMAALGEARREAARAVRVDALPAFETAWWETDREKPWSETYPAINHHTGEVPRAWARAARDCAEAWLLFEEPALAQTGKAVLLGLSEYSFAFEHYDVGMNYTTWGYQVLMAYDVFFDHFAPQERARMDAFFERLVTAVVKNDDYWVEHEPGGPMNNHYAWHKLARLMHGLFYDVPKMVEDALYGPKGVMDSLRYGFTDGGLWLEASLNYQFAQTSPMVLMARLLENAGSKHDLWHLGTGDGRTLKQAYDALLPTLFPDGTLPNIGDCYARRLALGSVGDYEALLTRFGDPAYAWLLSTREARPAQALFEGLTALPPGEAPRLASQVWPEHGYVMLRQRQGEDYWSGEGWTAFTTYSNAPVHQNQDKLSLMLFGEGHHWLVDAEARAGVYHAFSSAIQRELNRETVCHNTLLVDGASQRFPNRRLDLVEFYSLPEVKRVSVGDLDGRLYPGVRQLRTIIIRDRYVLDVFQVASDEAHTFAWLTHVDGEPGDCTLEGWAPETLPEGPPWRWLRDAEAADAPEGYGEAFTHEGQTFRLDVRTDGPARVMRCGFPRDDGPDADTYAMRAVERQGTSAWFAAVYQVGAAAPAPATVDIVTVEMGRLEAWVDLGGDVTRHLLPALR